MNWWRAHHGIANDPKLALVAMSRHVTPCHATRGDVLSVWVALLDFASQNSPRGSIEGIDSEQIAWYLEMPTEKVAAILQGFQDRRMVDGFDVVAWEKRQPKRDREDSTATTRKRRQRAMDTGQAHTQQTGAQPSRDNDTRAPNISMSENGNVTPCHAMSHTEERRLEEIRGEEKEQEQKRAPQSPFPKSCEEDEQYQIFVADYLATGAALIGEDFSNAWEWCWRKLDFDQKLQRIAGLNKHAEEYRADPRFVPKPQKFLETEWKREPKPLRAADSRPAQLNARERAKLALQGDKRALA